MSVTWVTLTWDGQAGNKRWSEDSESRESSWGLDENLPRQGRGEKD